MPVPLRHGGWLGTPALWLAGIWLLFASCHSAPPPREFNGQSAFGYLQTQMSFGVRIPGTEGHRREAEWLDSLLRSRAETLVVQQWSHVTARGDTLQLTNFIAHFNPKATERLLFLAHWDTRPRADNPASRDPKQPVPGANDGASGTALLLGVADVLKRAPPTVGVDLLFVDGEDYGDFTKTPDDVLMGSRYYAAHRVAGSDPLYAVLFDMVAGKNLKIFQEGNSVTGAPEVVELVWKKAADLGYAQYFIPTPKYTLIDDHVELQKVGIRAIDVVHFYPDYPYWHTPDDTIDKVTSESLQIVGDLALALVRR